MYTFFMWIFLSNNLKDKQKKTPNTTVLQTRLTVNMQICSSYCKHFIKFFNYLNLKGILSAI